MKICERHWIAFTESLPIQVLPLVSIVVSQEMLTEEMGEKFSWDYKAFQMEIEKNGGCPICYLGEDFYNLVLQKLKKEKVEAEEEEKEMKHKKEW